MPEALARIRREPTLSAPVRDTARQTPRAARPAAAKAAPARKWRIWAPKTAGGYAGLFMCLALLGIVVNAVSLQKERHPAPLFAPEAAPAPATPTPVAQQPPPAPPSAAVAPKPDPVAPPSPKPADHGVTVPPPPVRKTDLIGELVRSESAAERGKNLLAAQRALIKLGYDLQADGSMSSATIAALRDFETSHGLPPTSEVSPRLIAKLNAAAHGSDGLTR